MARMANGEARKEPTTKVVATPHTMFPLAHDSLSSQHHTTSWIFQEGTLYLRSEHTFIGKTPVSTNDKTVLCRNRHRVSSSGCCLCGCLLRLIDLRLDLDIDMVAH